MHAYATGTGVEFDTHDISLAGRIIATFPDRLREDQQIPDELTWLGELARTPVANIIKLPNISASIPQLQAAFTELQDQGYDIPIYTVEPKGDAEQALQRRFATVLGSAVNPVLREGNSDRRPAAAVKAFARKQPHRMMKAWPASGSQTGVAHMHEKDFYGSETSTTVKEAGDVRIEFVPTAGGSAPKRGLQRHHRRHVRRPEERSSGGTRAIRYYMALLKFMWVRNWLKGLQEAQ